MTGEEVCTLLQTLSVLYPGSRVEANPLTVQLWTEMLEDLPAQAVMLAVKRMAARLKFAPTIADIREAVAQMAEEARGTLSAGEAWDKVCSAVHRFGVYRGDEAHAFLGEELWTAVRWVGGWNQLCLRAGDPAVLYAQFERRYVDVVNQRIDRLQIPRGVREEMGLLFGQDGALLPEPD